MFNSLQKNINASPGIVDDLQSISFLFILKVSFEKYLYETSGEINKDRD